MPDAVNQIREVTVAMKTLVLALAFGLASSVALAQAPAGKVTVVTSFSKDVTDPIKKAFEKAPSRASRSKSRTATPMRA